MSSGKAYLECFGCQMNAFDTEILESLLEGEGFEIVSDPSSADVILLNTCSVRENAEVRAIGRLNDLSRHEKAVLGVCGCMSRRLGKKLFDMVPGLDMVAGPDSYSGVVEAVRSLMSGSGRRILLDEDENVTYNLERVAGSSPSKYLSITRGCENYCSYCIVPYVRGKVRSKSAEVVIKEIDMLVAAGVKEVTLLGQNVMAYSSGDMIFADLLERVLEDTDIRRVRFLTTHPRDVDRRIFDLMAENDRVCPHLHLPVQSGSDRILGMMNRGYTREEYLGIIETARSIRNDIAFTTDIIVGFPGETERDFEDTMEITEKVRFDSAFTFKYSPREGTKAANLPDDVPFDTKKSRLAVLNSVIQDIRKDIMKGRIGSVEEILLDGRVKKGEYQFLKGRTPHFRNVLVSQDGLASGEFARVVLKELRNFTFVGETYTGR